ncbi:MAG: RNA polymerase sigma factor [Planctomycetota bacterium]|nr:RNA polymerase sigma factor [Planctomycetota bacterium]
MPAPADPTLDRLLIAAMAGDRQAMVSLLEACTPRLRARLEPKISPALRSALDIDDVLQITYMEAFTRLSRFTGGGSSGFQAWLTTLAEHNLIDAIRSLEAARRPNPHKQVAGFAAGSRDSVVALVDLLGVSTATPSIHAARDEAAAHLERALKLLPKDYELVVRRYDLDGAPMDIVAKELGRSEGAAYMLRARAHDRLRDGMGPAQNFFSQT